MLKNTLRDELVLKFKDSCAIFRKVSGFFIDVPDIFTIFDAKTFFIVYAPINMDLAEDKKSRIIRILSTLKAQVSDSLEDGVCDEVELCLLSDFS